MNFLTSLKFLDFFSILSICYCLSCNNQNYRKILRGNYQDVLRLQQGPLIISRSNNTFSGGFDNGIMLRDSIYYLNSTVGRTQCILLQSIIVELKQAYELNTLIFWLWDRQGQVRTYGIVVYASYEGKETIIFDALAAAGVVRVKFTDQLVKEFRFYNINGNTDNTNLHIIKAEAFYEL